MVKKSSNVKEVRFGLGVSKSVELIGRSESLEERPFLYSS